MKLSKYLIIFFFLVIAGFTTLEARPGRVRFGFGLDVNQPSVVYYEPVPRFAFVPYPRYHDHYVILPYRGEVLVEDPYCRPLPPPFPLPVRNHFSFEFSVGR